MTRAWLSLIGMRPDLALAYHPLFWMLPLAAALPLAKSHLSNKSFRTILVVCIVLLIGVWAIRLVTPHDLNVLFSYLPSEDVVSAEAPVWLEALRHLLAP